MPPPERSADGREPWDRLATEADPLVAPEGWTRVFLPPEAPDGVHHFRATFGYAGAVVRRAMAILRAMEYSGPYHVLQLADEDRVGPVAIVPHGFPVPWRDEAAAVIVAPWREDDEEDARDWVKRSKVRMGPASNYLTEALIHWPPKEPPTRRECKHLRPGWDLCLHCGKDATSHAEVRRVAA